MSNFITSITGQTGITGAFFWTNITLVLPLILELLSFAFGFYVIGKLIKGIHDVKHGPRM